MVQVRRVDRRLIGPNSARRNKKRGPAQKNRLVGDADEMRWCAHCRAARQAFVNEEVSRQLLCNNLWNEMLQTHTQKLSHDETIGSVFRLSIHQHKQHNNKRGRTKGARQVTVASQPGSLRCVLREACLASSLARSVPIKTIEMQKPEKAGLPTLGSNL